MNGCRIVIDTGTTNTRISLLDVEGRLKDAVKYAVGVRDTAADGNNRKLVSALRDGIQEMKQRSHLAEEDIQWIAASGMITSDLGVCEVPHVTAPAGLQEIAAAVRKEKLPEIYSQPIFFIPGVKNDALNEKKSDYEAMDIMRGEETEALAVLHQIGAGAAGLIVLPGSHMKFVLTDCEGRMTGCLTTISGELLEQIVKHTILADATRGAFVSEADYSAEVLREGFAAAQNWGLTKACFSGRILSRFAGWEPQRVSNYLMGAVLESDVRAVRAYLEREKTGAVRIAVGGGGVLSRAIGDLLQMETFCSRFYEAASKKPLSVCGAELVMKEVQRLNHAAV